MDEVIDLLIPFCDAGSISVRHSSVRKRIVLGLAFVDVEVSAAFPKALSGSPLGSSIDSGPL